MCIDGRIDDLIEAGWGVLKSDFDPIAFHHWRRKAFDCLTALLGPDHAYTRQFEYLVRQGGKTDLLVAAGILSAAQQGIAGKGLEAGGTNGILTSIPLTEKNGGSTSRRDRF
jgi:hypothetical protein